MKFTKTIKKIILLFLIIAITVIVAYKYHETYAAYDIRDYIAISDDKNTYLRTATTYKRDTLLGKTTTWPADSGNSDYKKYVLSPDHPTLFCASHTQVNGSPSPLVIRGMIEIGGEDNKPLRARAYWMDSSGTKKSELISGVDDADKAMSVFTMMAGKNVGKDHVTGVAQQNFVDIFNITRYHSMNKFNDNNAQDHTANKLNINGKSYTVYEYRDAITSLTDPYNESNVKSDSYTCRNKEGKVSGLEYKTIIQCDRKSTSDNVLLTQYKNKLISSRKIKLTYTNNDTSTYTLHFEDSKWYLKNDDGVVRGRLVPSTGTIYLTLEKKVKKVEITLNYKYIHGIVYMLNGSAEQSRCVSLGELKDGKYTDSFDVKQLVTPPPEIASIQKHIVHVGKTLTTTTFKGSAAVKIGNASFGYSNATRNHRKATDASNPKISIENYAENDFVKRDKPVAISQGDYVVYKIDTYNNTGVRMNDRVVKDRIHASGVVKGMYTSRDSDTGTYYNEKPYEKYRSNYRVGGIKYNYYKWDVDLAATDKYDTVWVIVHYPDFIEGEIINKAFVRNKTTTNDDQDEDDYPRDYRVTDYEYAMMTTDVSLQKYIVEVGRIFSSATMDDIRYEYDNGRAYRPANTSTQIKVRKEHSNNSDKKTDTNQKKTDPVEVGVNEYVAYRITAYNNTNAKAEVVLTDKISTHAILVGIYQSRDDSTGKYGSKLTDYNQDSEKYSWKVKLAAKGTKDFYVVLRYPKLTYTGVIENKAYIDCDWNNSSYQQTDYDYVKLATHSVALEKYITEVNGAKITTDHTTLTDRAGHRDNRDSTKKENPVNLEAGNKVTYTIKLTNTGTAPIKNIKVTDKSNSNITYNNKTTNEFIHEGTIQPGASETITIEYTVSANAPASTLLENEAQIKSLQNKYGNEVPDDDGDENNIDYDWVKTKSYSVALEKYITEVNGAKITTAQTALDTRVGHRDDRDTTKKANPVKLEAGDKVKYIIKLTNTGSGSIKNIKVIDKSNAYLTYNNKTTNEFIHEGTIRSRGSITFAIEYTVSANAPASTLLENRAEIVELQDSNGNVVVDGDGATNNVDYDWVETKSYKVILEKYITKVNGVKITTAQTALDTRVGHRDDRDSTKKANPVEVETGDIVTYTIKLTNTGSAPIKNIKVTDTSNRYLTYDNKTTNEFIHTGTINPGADGYITEDYIVGATAPSATLLENKAEVKELQNKYGTTVQNTEPSARTVDYDWVKTKSYKVALEKFITKVGNDGITDAHTELVNRAGHRDDRDSTKKAKPVYLEIGDKVTYTIRLHNTGQTQIKNITVKDTSNTHLIYDNKTTNEFTYSGTIQPGGYGDIVIEYTVKDTAPTGTLLDNKAEVKSLQNKNGHVVTNGEEAKNTVDYDWVKTKIYKIAIEKYVCKVTNKAGGNVSTPSGRANHQEYKPDDYKKKNPVMLERGDKVTFKIVVRNLGDNALEYGYIKSFKVTDPVVAELKYESRNNTTDITSNSTNTEFTYVGSSLLAPVNGLYAFELTYTIADNARLGEIIANAATVSTLKNKNGKNVGDADGTGNNTDKDYVMPKLYEVKLEKYVYSVNGNTTLDPNIKRADNPIYKADPNKLDKEKRPVLVNKGDKVTYKIIVTNKGTNPTTHGTLKEIIISDPVPQYLEYSNPTVSGYDTSRLNVVYDVNSSKIKCTGVLGLNSSIEFCLTYQVKTGNNAPQGTIIRNTATIDKLYNGNLVEVSDCNDPDPTDNVDRDWIKIRVTSVAIEKYISEVTSPMGTTTTQDDQKVAYENDRKDKRFNEYYKDEYANLGPKNNDYKKNKHVKVETGDIVTFTIKLQNTGELPIKINEFYDSYTYYSNQSDFRYGIGLEYVNNSIKNVSQNSKISRVTINTSQEYNKGPGRTDFRRYLVKVDWNDYLAPGAEEKIEIKFKVLSPVRGKVLFFNKVGIVKMTDIYNQNFTWHVGTADFMSQNNNTKEGDFDGPNNNYDMDFLEVQEYRVSLQKVVTQVLNKDIVVGNRWDSWESHANTCKCAETNSGCNTTTPICAKCGVESHYIMGCICDLLAKNCVDANRDNICDSCKHDMKYVSARDNTGNTIVACEHKQEQTNPGNKYNKHNNPVVVENGDFVRFAVRVKNDGDTKVKVTRIYDKLPEGVELQYIEKRAPDGTNTIMRENTSIKGNSIAYDDPNLPLGEYTYDRTSNEVYIFPQHVDGLLSTQETDIYYITVKVTQTNMSVDVMKNHAFISWIRNKNEYTRAKDVTMGDNSDSDYIQMKDIEISGIVWNDKALDKTGDDYDGNYDASAENVLEGVTVKLYRVTNNGTNKTLVAQKETDSQGKYTFTRDDIIVFNAITEQCDRYIKGPYKCADEKYTGTNGRHGANYWAGTYYSYYVVFEYDGITYTSTVYTEFGHPNDTNLTSNAREKEKASDGFDGQVEQSRTEFNNRYNTINDKGAFKGEVPSNENHNKTLMYDTINENSYIPASVLNLDKTMEVSGEDRKAIFMQSSTKQIALAKNIELEEKLQHVNMGLRGRDIFDLELLSDVAQVEVTVNKQKGVYKYENKVTIRESDILENNGIVEDSANIEKGDVREVGNSKTVMTEGVIESYQDIRELDLKPDTTKTINDYKQEDGLQSIFVTYKITVRNASKTNGVATKVRSYFDKKYNFIGAYNNLPDAESRTQDPEFLLNVVEENDSNPKYNYRVFETKWDTMTQSETKEIYLVYELKPEQFTNITTAGLPTYNMAEIAEYKTSLGEGQTEFTRGLIDKDSAPGSVDKEQVRTIDTEGQNTPTVGGNPTTVEYYFGGYDLTKLKYEDDTYAAPTLYFREVEDTRILTGRVFEDLTKIHPTTKIKTGNGKLDAGEVGVFGARVQLIELSDGEVVRYEKETDKEGKFEFTGFLPGNYIIKYFYGDTSNTVLTNQTTFNSTKINAKSYNGEDFQSTNNSYNIAGMETNILDRTPNYWYLYNEEKGISTASDDANRRLKVSENVTAFIDEQMEVLNNIRDGRDNVNVTYTQEDGTTNTITIGSLTEDPNASMNIIPKTYMYASTEPMIFTVEKTELVKNNAGEVTGTIQRTSFGEYKIENMNFGIAEVPVTKVDLRKNVTELEIKDSTGENILIRLRKDGDNWVTVGDVIPAGDLINVQIPNEQLQGAKLKVRFTISVDIDTEVNYDGVSCVVPKITGFADFINNNLSYNPNLSYSDGANIISNSKNWEVATHEEIKEILKEQKKYDLITEPQGTVDPLGNIYTVVLKATGTNPLIGASEGYNSVDIVFEKVLTSTELTIDDIITSAIDLSEYNNIVEIIGFDYIPRPGAPAGGGAAGGAPAGGPLAGGTGAMRDRVRNPERYIILPGVQYDNAISETIVIIPPTGTTEINTVYYIIAAIALGILAAGVYGIKKFIIKK